MSYALRDYALSPNICYEHTIYTSYGMVGHGEKTQITWSYLHIPGLQTKFSCCSFLSIKLCHRLLVLLNLWLLKSFPFVIVTSRTTTFPATGPRSPLFSFHTLLRQTEAGPTRRRSVPLINLSTGTGFWMQCVNPLREDGSRSQYTYWAGPLWVVPVGENVVIDYIRWSWLLTVTVFSSDDD